MIKVWKALLVGVIASILATVFIQLVTDWDFFAYLTELLKGILYFIRGPVVSSLLLIAILLIALWQFWIRFPTRLQPADTNTKAIFITMICVISIFCMTVAISLLLINDLWKSGIDRSMRISSQFEQKYLTGTQESRLEAARLYPGNPEIGHPVLEMFNFFDSIGEAYKLGAIRDDDVLNFKEPILLYHCAWGDWIEAFRDQQQDDTIWDKFDAIAQVAIRDNGGKCYTQVQIDQGFIDEQQSLEQKINMGQPEIRHNLELSRLK